MNSSPRPYLNVTRPVSIQRGIRSTSSCSTLTHPTGPMPSGKRPERVSADLRSRELTKAAARRLFNHDLIGFYRVDDGYPDLSDSERSTIFRGITYWDKNHGDAALVGIFLTTAGEEIVLGP